MYTNLLLWVTFQIIQNNELHKTDGVGSYPTRVDAFAQAIRLVSSWDLRNGKNV